MLSSSTNNFAHAQTLSRMSSLSDRMNIARVNIGFFSGFKKIKQRRISFTLGYLRMILWKISTAISIKHRILATFNIKKKIQFWHGNQHNHCLGRMHWHRNCKPFMARKQRTLCGYRTLDLWRCPKWVFYDKICNYGYLGHFVNTCNHGHILFRGEWVIIA